MTTAAVLNIQIKANSAHATANLKKTDAQLRSTEAQTKKSGKAFAALGTAAKVGGLALAGGLAVGLKKAHQEAREAAKVGRQTNAVLKSTGGAAKVSRKEIEGLAEAISEKAGIDDEAIQSAENLLLTFTKVRNETGRGNKIFSSATQVVTDMSVALDQGLKSSTIQVGKALNDPIKGITALSRVGVTFTQQQKDQIKAMVESGNVLGAQKAILKELTVEFGGSAAAQADGLDRLKVTANNLLETLGGPLNTALNKAADATSGFLLSLRAGQGSGAGFGAAVRSQFDQIKQAAGITSGDVRKAGQAMSNAFSAVRAVAERVFPAVQQIMRGFAQGLGGIVKVITGVLTLDFGQAWRGIKSIFSGGIRSAIGTLRAATAPAREAAAAVFKPIGRVATDVFNGIKSAVKSAIRFVLARLQDFLTLASKIPVVGKQFEAAKRGVDKLIASLDGVRKRKNTTVNVRLQFKVKGAGTGQLPGFGEPRTFMERAIAQVGQNYATANPGIFGPMPGDGGGPLMGGSFKGGTYKKANAIARRFGLRVSSGYRSPKHNAAVGGVPGSLHTHGSASNPGAIDLVGSTGAMYKALAYARSHIKGLKEALVHDVGSGLHLHLGFFRRGGMVGGSGSGDKMPAMLEPGEGVINRKAVAAMGGKRAIDGLNAAVPRFQGGGVVGTWGSMVKRAAKRGKWPSRKAAVIYEAMLRANAVEAGSLGGNPTGGTGTSAGYFQMTSEKGSVAQRRNARFAGSWFIKTASGAYRPGISAALLAANTERPAAQYRGRYADPSFVPVGRVARLVAAFQKGLGEGAKAPKKGGRKGGGGGILGSKGLGPGQLFANRKAVTGRDITSGGFGKGRPFTSTIPPRTISPVDLSGDVGGSDGPSGPSPAELLVEAIKAQAETSRDLKASIDEQNRIASSALAVGYREALRFIADGVSGQIARNTDQRRQSASDGRLARY
jgi:hypothetical protein